MSGWADLPWAPLFADHAVPSKVCWTREVSVAAPVAVPPPWEGTATITIAPGCAEVTELRSKGVFWSLDLRGTAVVVTMEIHRGGATASSVTWQSGRVTFDRTGVGLAQGMDTAWVLLGDALPYAPEGRDLDDMFDGFRYEWFFCDTGIALEDLIRATGTTPYAGIGVNLAQSADMGPIGIRIPVQPDFGPPTAERRAALETVDPSRLTPWQRKMLTKMRTERPLRPGEDRTPTCPRG